MKRFYFDRIFLIICILKNLSFCLGLADAFILMRYPFESPEAQLLNKQIFETLYYAGIVIFLKIQIFFLLMMEPKDFYIPNRKS